MQNNHIAILLQADERWLPLLRDGIGRYAQCVGFSKALEDRITSSIIGACEALIRVSEQTGIAKPFNVNLDYRGEAVIIEIEYSRRIPLNPFETEEYEVPDADADSVSTDGMWLFLIKKEMDRVFFGERGKKRVLCIMEYRREEGMENRVWAMSLRPRLRKGLTLYLKDADNGHPSSVLEKRGGVLLLGPSETFFIQNMNGVKTLHDLYMAHVDEIGLVSPNLPGTLYEKLEAMDMLAPFEDETRPDRWKRLFNKIINPNLSIPKGDDVITWIHQWTQFFFTPIGVSLLLLTGVSGIVPLWYTHHHLWEKVVKMEHMLFDSPHLLIPLYVMTLIHVSLHEIGHGVTCKHFGGKVPRMGIMFYLASFIFFCDTTAAYNFPEKRHRLLVSLGGPIVSFAIFGLGLWGMGYFADSDSLWEYVFVAFSLVNFISLVMNFIPFIKMDAYYMLMDLTGIPNLRVKSFRFLKRKLLGWLGFGSEEDVKVTMKETRTFWWYGLLGSVITLMFVAAPFLEIIQLLRAHSLYGGRAVFLILVCILVMARLAALAFKRLESMFYWEKELK